MQGLHRGCSTTVRQHLPLSLVTRRLSKALSRVITSPPDRRARQSRQWHLGQPALSPAIGVEVCQCAAAAAFHRGIHRLGAEMGGLRANAGAVLGASQSRSEQFPGQQSGATAARGAPDRRKSISSFCGGGSCLSFSHSFSSDLGIRRLGL